MQTGAFTNAQAPWHAGANLRSLTGCYHRGVRNAVALSRRSGGLVPAMQRPAVVSIDDDDGHDGDDNLEGSQTARSEQGVPRPSGIERLWACVNLRGVAFADTLGDVGQCACIGACLCGICSNATAGIYCGSANCSVGDDCGNRCEELTSLRLVMTRTGLGVATTLPLPPDICVGEYCSVLSCGTEFTPEMRRRGFGFKFTEPSIAGECVYYDASERGSLCRFVNHSCVPNWRFEVIVNQGGRRVAVVTSEVVPVRR